MTAPAAAGPVAAAVPAVRVRPFDETGDADTAALVRMFARLSPTSVFRRFFAPVPRLEGALLRALTAVDHDRHEALVAEAGGEIVGVARYVRSADDPSRADVAVTVEDAWQRRGVGSLLLRRLGRLASDRGIERLTADVLTENTPTLALVRKLAPGAASERDGPEITMSVPLRRTAPGDQVTTRTPAVTAAPTTTITTNGARRPAAMAAAATPAARASS